MLKTALKKVMWLTRGMLWLAKGTSILVGLTVMVALTAGLVSQATAANGGNVILGSLNNTATALTRLSGNVAGPALQIINNNAAANATALNLATRADRPPMRVNSATKVSNLNADMVDGESLTCPTGKLLHEGVCISTTKHTAAGFITAENTCLSERSRLPTLEELLTFRSRAGTDFTGEELTSHFFMDNGASFTYIVDANSPGSLGTVASNNGRPYRCVAATTP
jgi:hypothetical protein